MTDLLSLLATPDDEKAFLRVGQFIWHWSSLEGDVAHGLHRLLGATDLDATVMLANLQVRDKISALKTYLHLYSPTEDAGAKAIAILTKIGDMADERNKVVHNAFLGTPEGVAFSMVRAKGKLDFPKPVWSDQVFAEKIETMNLLSGQLRRAVNAAATFKARWLASRAPLTDVPNYFAAAAAPSSGPGMLGGLYHLGRLALENSDSQLPNLITGPQTPKAPPKKSEGRKKR